MERMTARVCREAGGRVSPNMLLRDMNLDGIRPDDGRQIEVVVTGLPIFRGAQLAVDATLVSALNRDGEPQPHTDTTDGAWLQEARRRKERAYPELLQSRRCKLVVLGIEVGGRWSAESVHFVRALAKAKARKSPKVLRKSAEMAWFGRWTALLTVAAQRAFAASLLDLPATRMAEHDGEEPCTVDVLCDSCSVELPVPSRMA